jgi:hypothetical protein
MKLTAARAALALCLFGCGGNIYNVNLFPVNNSNETGSATINDPGNGALMVNVSVGNVPASTTQPSHIHSGRCAQPGPILQVLNSLVNASLSIELVPVTTAINAKYFNLAGKAYLDVHASTSDSAVVMCGDI